MNFNIFFIKRKTTVDRELKRFFADREKEYKNLDSLLFEMTVNVRKHVLRGGKRGRPFLCFLAYKLVGGIDNKAITRASISLELLHQFLLTHDDIVDRDEKRYGGPTLEMVYKDIFKRKFGVDENHPGKALAMIAGDLLEQLGYKALYSSEFGEKIVLEAAQEINKVAIETVAGWQIQYFQNFELISEANQKQFLKGMELVSAKYSFELPLMVGLILAGKKQVYEKILTKYAYHVGMAYQIQDDILGVFGKSKKTGKPSGNDVREGKKTLLILKAYKNASSKEKEFMKKVIGTDLNSRELNQVREIIKTTGSFDESKKMAQDHIIKGKSVLEKLPRKADKQAIEKFKQLADFAVKRKF